MIVGTGFSLSLDKFGCLFITRIVIKNDGVYICIRRFEQNNLQEIETALTLHQIDRFKHTKYNNLPELEYLHESSEWMNCGTSYTVSGLYMSDTGDCFVAVSLPHNQPLLVELNNFLEQYNQYRPKSA